MSAPAALLSATPKPLPAGFAERFRESSEPVEGGHRQWTGEYRTSRGAGRFRHDGKMYSAAQAAFLIRTGRAPVGSVWATCQHPHCCEPAHVDDRETRQRQRSTLAAIKGIQHRPPSCEHDQAEHGRYRSDGKRYCNRCNQIASAPYRCHYGADPCGARGARFYPSGWLCDEHQPANTGVHDPRTR